MLGGKDRAREEQFGGHEDSEVGTDEEAGSDEEEGVRTGSKRKRSGIEEGSGATKRR